MIVQERRPRLNAEISAQEVRLIGIEGELIGIVSVGEAMVLAEEAGVDLVEIVPNATPPVCRVVDFGKWKYQEAKKAHEAKLKQKVVLVKEIKFRPVTDEADYQVKCRSIQRFLSEGDKVKVTLRFRGREMAHQEIGVRLLERLRLDFDDQAIIEQFPRLEGRQMVMVFAPKPVVKKKV